MRKINNSTLFLYGMTIVCNVFLLGVYIPDSIWKYILIFLSGICIGNIIHSLVWGKKE